MGETRVMLGAPALLLVHPAIIANSLNVPAPFFFVFKFMFKGFLHLQFMTDCRPLQRRDNVAYESITHSIFIFSVQCNGEIMQPTS